MGMRAARLAAAMGCVVFLSSFASKPNDWVPMRWGWTDPASLELLSGGPVNCLLLREYSPDFLAAATAHDIVTLAVVSPNGGAADAARNALKAGATGLALEGEFTTDALAEITRAAGAAPVVELTSRGRLIEDRGAAILATNQGVWPGIALEDNGARRAGPSGSVWINTNTGFLRLVRAWSGAPLWIANDPPAKTVLPAARYEQAIADAAISGARWVISLDSDFAARLAARDAKALADWRRILAVAGYFEAHPEWRGMRESGALALIQDPAKGGVLSGGILDMIAARHTPVRPIPADSVSADALKGASMAVNVDGDALDAGARDALRSFTRGGGMLLNGPPGWSDPVPDGGSITLGRAELARLNDIWRDVNSMIGRRNLGVRLFNAASMLSNYLVSADGKTAVLHLVNYSDYPIENVTAHLLDRFRRATLLSPESAPKPLEIHVTEEASEIDIDRISICATVLLEQ